MTKQTYPTKISLKGGITQCVILPKNVREYLKTKVGEPVTVTIIKKEATK